MLRRAFTLVEVLVVIAVIGVILAMLLPALGSVKESAGESTCASNLKHLGAATISYLAAWDDCLPQVAAFNPISGQTEIIGSLFGGKRGKLGMFGINQVGSDKRPLNKFLGSGVYTVDTDPNDGNDTEDVPYFECPLDRGEPAQPPFLPQVESMYDFIGTSYTLNDHSLDGESCWTLVPRRTPACPCTPGPAIPQRPGGKMPAVADPSKTWLLGDVPIYNFQEGGDRKQHWHYKDTRVNLCFVDGHVGQGIKVQPGITNITKQYSFLPDPDWQSPTSQAQRCVCCP